MKQINKFVKKFDEKNAYSVFGKLLMAWNHGPQQTHPHD